MITHGFTVRVTRPVAIAIVVSAMIATVTAQHYRTDKKYAPTLRTSNATAGASQG